jgi:hypothetical protein
MKLCPREANSLLIGIVLVAGISKIALPGAIFVFVINAQEMLFAMRRLTDDNGNRFALSFCNEPPKCRAGICHRHLLMFAVFSQWLSFVESDSSRIPDDTRGVSKK